MRSVHFLDVIRRKWYFHDNVIFTVMDFIFQTYWQRYFQNKKDLKFYLKDTKMQLMSKFKWNHDIFYDAMDENDNFSIYFDANEFHFSNLTKIFSYEKARFLIFLIFWYSLMIIVYNISVPTYSWLFFFVITGSLKWH